MTLRCNKLKENIFNQKNKITKLKEERRNAMDLNRLETLCGANLHPDSNK